MKIGETDISKNSNRKKDEKIQVQYKNSKYIFSSFFRGDDRGTKKMCERKILALLWSLFFVWKCLVSVWIYDRKKLCCKMSNYKIVKFPNTHRQQKN